LSRNKKIDNMETPLKEQQLIPTTKVEPLTDYEINDESQSTT